MDRRLVRLLMLSGPLRVGHGAQGTRQDSPELFAAPLVDTSRIAHSPSLTTEVHQPGSLDRVVEPASWRHNRSANHSRNRGSRGVNEMESVPVGLLDGFDNACPATGRR
ncbi:MAG: hypothetical protein CMJ59_00500 [Planctomycetaceae bacterium]|nr:hypothetical protein [Planctomycetaceae bacterium]